MDEWMSTRESGGLGESDRREGGEADKDRDPTNSDRRRLTAITYAFQHQSIPVQPPTTDRLTDTWTVASSLTLHRRHSWLRHHHWRQ